MFLFLNTYKNKLTNNYFYISYFIHLSLKVSVSPSFFLTFVR